MQISLLQNFAAQAVIAMENARLHNRDARGAGAADRDRRGVEVINSSPGDLAPVFNAILEKAHTVCGVTSGGLLIRDGEAFRVAAAHGNSPYTADQAQQGFSDHQKEVRCGGSCVARSSSILPTLETTIATATHRATRELSIWAAFAPCCKCRCGRMANSRRDHGLPPEMQPFTDKQIAFLQISRRRRSSQWRTRGS